MSFSPMGMTGMQPTTYPNFQPPSPPPPGTFNPNNMAANLNFQPPQQFATIPPMPQPQTMGVDASAMFGAPGAFGAPAPQPQFTMPQLPQTMSFPGAMNNIVPGPNNAIYGGSAPNLLSPPSLPAGMGQNFQAYA